MTRNLQESKAKLEEAQRITHVGYWEWDLLTDRVNWSDETYRKFTDCDPHGKPSNRRRILGSCTPGRLRVHETRHCEDGFGRPSCFRLHKTNCAADGEIRTDTLRG